MPSRVLTVSVAFQLAALACSPAQRGRTETAQANGAAADSSAPAGAELRAAPAKPNEQMQAVLDQLAALHPRPITALPAAEARKQPSPADAVKALLKSRARAQLRSRWGA